MGRTVTQGSSRIGSSGQGCFPEKEKFKQTPAKGWRRRGCLNLKAQGIEGASIQKVGETGQWKRGQKPGMVAPTCNPSTLGDQGRRITRGQEFKTSLAILEKPCLY